MKVGTDHRARPRLATAGLIALAVLGLLAVVAIGARGTHPLGNGRLSQRQVPDTVSNDLLTTIIVVYVAAVLATAVILWRGRGAWRPVRSTWLRRFFVTMVFFVALGFFLAQFEAIRHAHGHTHATAATSQKAAAQAQHAHPSLPTNDNAHFDWAFAVGLLSLLAVGGVFYVVRQRRAEQPTDRTEAAVAEELSAAVSESIDDLVREPDPRRAVIAAYARMEGVLARSGYSRHPAETPLEYLARVLRALDVGGGSIRELTELFEQAKFSAHTIDQSMKGRAIACFTRVRDDLRREALAA